MWVILPKLGDYFAWDTDRQTDMILESHIETLSANTKFQYKAQNWKLVVNPSMHLQMTGMHDNHQANPLAD